jgi:predicted amidophosphoribosyltransferase
VLRLVSDVQDSAGLSVSARLANLDHAMRAHPPPAPGIAAVLVDDVVTTGTTLREARRALCAAGWPVLGAAAVARTPLRGTDRIHIVSPGMTEGGGLTL